MMPTRERWLNQHDDDEETKLFQELSPTISAISRIILNTGLRPPKEILLMEKEHVNLTDRVKRLKLDKVYMIPLTPSSLPTARTEQQE